MQFREKNNVILDSILQLHRFTDNKSREIACSVVLEYYAPKELSMP